jgi:hypothetical protein
MAFMPFATTIGTFFGATGATAGIVGGTIEAAALLTTATVVESQQAMKEQKKAMTDLMASQPVSPISEVSEEKQKTAAEDTVTAQRRMLLLSGGETDVTGGKAELKSSSLSSKVLLGATQ